MEELFLIPFAGSQYGIRKGDIQAVKSLDALHRFPLSPACIAGIMIEGGHSVTLANLPVCIGSESTQEIKQGCILLMKEGERLMGFVVGGEVRIQSVSPQLLFPLPDYLKTPVFDACAVHNNIPIPLINIATLYARVLKPGEGTSVDSFRISGVQPLDISGMERIRLFSLGGESFAVSATGIEDDAVKPGPVTPLPNTPQYVKGITVCKGRLLPAIDLSQRIKWQGGSPEPLMLVAGIGGAAFGMLIDSEEGTVSADEVAIEPVPFIIQTAWLKHMAVRAGKLIPLIDLAMALSQGSAADEEPIWQRYAPDSVFPENFFKREVEVVEFSLLGELYALPKNEVEDVISFKPCRALPDVPLIVTGVVEHNGEILPVVDLAMMFGRRSLATPAWRMMLVRNGNFRALVVTEAVYEGRRLPPEVHRTVPIHLPHNLMYGCYPEGKAARIILNVEAISVRFEKSLIKKFLPSLSQEMMTSATGEVYAFPSEKTFGTPHALATGTAAASQSSGETRPLAVAMAQAITGASVNSIASACAEEGEPGRHSEAQTGLDARNAEFPGDVAHAADTHSSTQETQGMNTPLTPEAVHALKHEAPAETLSKVTIAPEMPQAEAESPQPIAALRDTSNQPRSGEISTTREPANMEAQSADTATITPASEGGAVLTQTRDAADPEHGTLLRANREVEQVSMPPFDEARRPGQWSRKIAFDMTAAVLIAALILFSGILDRQGAEKLMKASEAVKIGQPTRLPEQASLLSGSIKMKAVPAEVTAGQTKTPVEREKPLIQQTEVQAKAERETRHQQSLALTQQIKAQTELSRPMDKTHAPLELVIPKNMPKVDIDEYVVVQGDTLWSISERFTGNPFNYPRIAGQNRIADPDLIFQGQRIRLIK